MSVDCTTDRGQGLPCLADAQQACGGKAELVALLSAWEMPVLPMGHGNRTAWRYIAKYRCQSK